MMLTLYTAPGSCSRASHIALEESGLEFEVRLVDLVRGDQRRPEYLAMNPKGRVPALVTDQGVLTESPALLAYIAALAPPGLLAPVDPFALARMQAFNLYLAATVQVAHAHGRRASRWSDDVAAQASMAAKVTQNMRDCFTLIEADLEGDWVMGDVYSVADPYLFTFSAWLESDGVDIAEFPRVQAHYQRMTQRPAVARALKVEGLPHA
ncbi:MAG: glutathione S-transferase N-terminal domain-containing protein [Brevundimonas sp.]|uniref:glutathione S-transferase family protein n=1 Tax=Brevundimonas sp. TaxID=1871086 RepID=UPI00271DC16F|nr:glutathione S-transferase N-terminal domain-containing protein [Brevundimonas sp.]MDO9608862.1 glutathione S-transferase N-terminal domain-containing protein [Brevundimonas sp.]